MSDTKIFRPWHFPENLNDISANIAMDNTVVKVPPSSQENEATSSCSLSSSCLPIFEDYKTESLQQNVTSDSSRISSVVRRSASSYNTSINNMPCSENRTAKITFLDTKNDLNISQQDSIHYSASSPHNASILEGKEENKIEQGTRSQFSSVRLANSFLKCKSHRSKGLPLIDNRLHMTSIINSDTALSSLSVPILPRFYYELPGGYFGTYPECFSGTYPGILPSVHPGVCAQVPAGHREMYPRTHPRIDNLFFPTLLCPHPMAQAVQEVHEQEVVARQIKKMRPKKFRCEHCNVAFSNNGQLRGHIRIHTGERPYKCNVESCGKAFTRNEELTRHKRIHTGDRPHPCMVCGKCFGRKDHLKKHMRTHEARVSSMPLSMIALGQQLSQTSGISTIPPYTYQI